MSRETGCSSFLPRTFAAAIPERTRSQNLSSRSNLAMPATTVASMRVFQQAGLIRYGQGRLAITDRPGPEAAACECYSAVRHRFELVLAVRLGSARG